MYVATSSLGTQAGLAVGAAAFSAPFAIQGIAVEGTADELAGVGALLANATAELLQWEGSFTAREVLVDDRFVGAGYGKASAEGMEALHLLARTEGIFLDPAYTAKAMAGMLADIRAGAFNTNDAIVFLHTGGGPSLFPWGEALLEPAGTTG